MKTWLGLLVASTTLAAVGCGNTVDIATGGAGGESSIVATGPGVTTATASTTTGAGGACGGFADSKGTEPVTVRFKNEGNVPIYLPYNCTNIDYSITLPGGPANTSYAFDGSCLQTCFVLKTEPILNCGACAPASFRLDPGASHDVLWNGTGLTSRMMAAQCWNDPKQAQGSCGQIIDAPSGAYHVDVVGYAKCDGNCQCDVNGVCSGNPTGAVAYPNPTQLDFPGDSVVEVVFGVCAFPCPL